MDQYGNPPKNPGGVTVTRWVYPTWPGITFFLLGLFVFFASHNTGNNTLYLIAAGLLALFLVNHFLATLNALALEFEPDIPDACFAGTPVSISWKLREPLGRNRFWLSTTHEFLDHFDKNQTVSLKSMHPPFARGRVPLPPLRIFSPFPLGLSMYQLTATSSRELVVFPAPRPAFLEGFAAGSAARLENTLEESGDYWMHRPYTDGEDARQIHWKVSARSDREYIVLNSIAQQAALRLHFALETCPEDQFEVFLEHITGFLLRLHREESHSWCWVPQAGQAGNWLSVGDPTGLLNVLEFLATVSAVQSAHLSPPPADVSVHTIGYADFGPDVGGFPAS